jgi:hypothetical protein
MEVNVVGLRRGKQKMVLLEDVRLKERLGSNMSDWIVLLVELWGVLALLALVLMIIYLILTDW